MVQKSKLFTRDYVYGWIARFFCYNTFMMLMTITAPYCMATYGSSAAEAGLAAGAYVLAATVVRLFAGRGIDAFGRRKSMLWGSALYLACSALHLVPMGFVPFVVLRVVNGAVFGWVATAINVVTVELVPRDRLGEGLGYFALASCIAFGQLVGVAVFQNGPGYAVFVVAVAFCLVQMAMCLALPVVELQDVLDAEAEQMVEDGGNLGEAAANCLPEKPRFSIFYLLSKGAIPLSLVAGVSTVCYSSTTSFIEPYSSSIGLGQFTSVFFIVYSVVLILVRPIFGKLLDKGYEKPIMITAFILFAASYVLLAFCQNGEMILIAAVCLAIGFSGANSNMLSIILTFLPRRETSLATATFYLMLDAGTGLGPTLMGLIVEALGYTGMYATDAIISLLLTAIYLYLRRNAFASTQARQ